MMVFCFFFFFDFLFFLFFFVIFWIFLAQKEVFQDVWVIFFHFRWQRRILGCLGCKNLRWFLAGSNLWSFKLAFTILGVFVCSELLQSCACIISRLALADSLLATL